MSVNDLKSGFNVCYEEVFTAAPVETDVDDFSRPSKGFFIFFLQQPAPSYRLPRCWSQCTH